MPPQYQELHKQQAAIGWDQILYGRWSEHWRILQQQHLATPETMIWLDNRPYYTDLE
jgi:hypothetical protein